MASLKYVLVALVCFVAPACGDDGSNPSSASGGAAQGGAVGAGTALSGGKSAGAGDVSAGVGGTSAGAAPIGSAGTTADAGAGGDREDPASAGASSGGAASDGGTDAGAPVVGGAAGGDDAAAGSAGFTDASFAASVEITAAEGGEVMMDDARLAIDAGALATDTAITVEVREPPATLPELNSVQGSLYDFGPDGLVFNEPAALTLPLRVAPSAGQLAVISWLDADTNTWHDLDASVSGATVTALVPHFTSFVVRSVDAPVDDCSFDACGGDLVGTWTIDGACVDANPDPFILCPAAVIDVASDVSGTFVFADDGAYSASFTESGTIVGEVPAECVGSGGCAPFANYIDGTCSETPSAGCACTGPMPAKVTDQSGTYSVSAATLTITPDGEAGELDDYCVSGAQLKIRTHRTDGSTMVFVATKR